MKNYVPERIYRRHSAALMGAVLAIILNSPAHAEQISMQEMQKRLEELTARVEKLSATVEAQNDIIKAQDTALQSREARLMERAEKLVQEQLATDSIRAKGAMTSESDIKMSMAPSPRIESRDGKYSFQPFGRVHLDYTMFHDDRRDHPNSGDFRRARLGFKGRLGKDFDYKFEVDFAREAVNFKNVSLTYTGMNFTDFQIGHFKPVLGLQQNTSSNYIQFLERAAPTNAFTRDEELGLAFRSGGKTWSFAAGAFNADAGSTSASDDEAWSADIRGSVDLLGKSPHTLHAGLGASYRVPNAGTDSLALSARATGVGNNLVSTGNIANVEHENVFGAELAGVYDSFSVQGEYFINHIDRDPAGGLDNPSFSGWYGQIGYLLTGEIRPYKASTGNFGRIKPLNPFDPGKGRWGAWEITARYETLDLNDSSAGITGGEMTNHTLGLNWYLTDYIRLMADYITVDTDSNAPVADDDPDIINLRAQWDF